jgi:hypothetical protein
LKNPNTIRTFSAAFSQKALCSGFQTNAERQLCAQNQTFPCLLQFPESGQKAGWDLMAVSMPEAERKFITASGRRPPNHQVRQRRTCCL